MELIAIKKFHGQVFVFRYSPSHSFWLLFECNFAFHFILGVVTVLSNIDNFFFKQKYSILETSGSTNPNHATLTTPKHSK